MFKSFAAIMAGAALLASATTAGAAVFVSAGSATPTLLANVTGNTRHRDG